MLIYTPHPIPSGVHNVGSYGTRGKVTAAGGQYNDRLSLVADYNRTGFVGPYGGDYFTPVAPLEGNQSYLTLDVFIGYGN